MNRRGLLKGILAAGMAPAVVGSGILMPLGRVWTPYAFDLGRWNEFWEENLLRKYGLSDGPAIHCVYKGFFWTASGETVTWSKLENPATFDL